jgi:anhydro-N-acetylmuramic acid kinase
MYISYITALERFGKLRDKATGNPTVWAIGLMSGTSLDGIDVALLRTDGETIAETGPWLTLPFDEATKAHVREAVHGRGDMLRAEHEITLLHAQAVQVLLRKAEMKPKDVTVIGFHGQTVAHRPAEGLTWQIGDGALLAEKTKIDVVCDFRRRDMAAGGVGAPLVPLYHAALVRGMTLPLVVLNVGGICNVTWIGSSEGTSTDLLSFDILAFDTGPGNVLINEWAYQHTGVDFDKDGALALAGKPDAFILRQMMKDRYFSEAPPKSLDRNYFSFAPVLKLSKEDGSATLTEFTAMACKEGSRYFPVPAKTWYVAGGGRHNPALMQALARQLGEAHPAETLGWVGDALEAQAFAFLAVRSLRGLPLSLPTTTGADRPVTGGAFHRAGERITTFGN